MAFMELNPLSDIGVLFLIATARPTAETCAVGWSTEMHHYTAIAEISRLIVNTAQLSTSPFPTGGEGRDFFPSSAMEDMIWHPEREEKRDGNAAEFSQTGV
jgi:hypothetical protein